MDPTERRIPTNHHGHQPLYNAHIDARKKYREGCRGTPGGKITRRFTIWHQNLLVFWHKLRAALPRPPTTALPAPSASALPRCYNAVCLPTAVP